MFIPYGCTSQLEKLFAEECDAFFKQSEFVTLSEAAKEVKSVVQVL